MQLISATALFEVPLSRLVPSFDNDRLYHINACWWLRSLTGVLKLVMFGPPLKPRTRSSEYCGCSKRVLSDITYNTLQ